MDKFVEHLNPVAVVLFAIGLIEVILIYALMCCEIEYHDHVDCIEKISGIKNYREFTEIDKSSQRLLVNKCYEIKVKKVHKEVFDATAK